MSTLFITGLVLMGVAFVLSIFVFLGAVKNILGIFMGDKEFEPSFNTHVGSMKRMVLLKSVWVVGIVITVIAIVRDYVIN